MPDIFDVLDDPDAPEWVHWYVWETFTGERAMDHLADLKSTPYQSKRVHDTRRSKTRDYRRHGFSVRRACPQAHRPQPSSYRAPQHRQSIAGPRLPAERE